jgi:Fic-DOC domain mobile mystery protein B
MALLEHLPGETPIDDWSGLKIKGIQFRRQLNEVEAQNILKATLKYFARPITLRDAPFDYAWGLQLHREMFGDVWTWAGELRGTQTTIGVPVPLIEHQLYELFVSLSYWKEMPWVEQAARLHHRAVQIHPFLNGNGRWSRLLANIWLRLHDEPAILWPEPDVGTASTIRQEYIQAVRAADNGDYDRLIDLHCRFAQPE